MDRLEAMATLLAAIEAGSLSAAARRLRTPLPTVSRRISELESHIGTRLLTRSNRSLILTDAGNSYVAACKRILADVTEAERTAAGEYSAPTGELVVTAPSTLGRTHLIPVMTEFFKAYPHIKATLLLSERTHNLVQEEIDVAFRIGPLPDSSMIAIRVGTVQRAVCASPAYLADRGVPLVPEDLANHDCITVLGVTSPNVWTFLKDKAVVSVPINTRLVVTNAEAACDAAAAGMGISRTFAYNARSGLTSGALTKVLDAFLPEPLPVHLLYAADRILPIKVRAFLDLAVPLLRKALVD